MCAAQHTYIMSSPQSFGIILRAPQQQQGGDKNNKENKNMTTHPVLNSVAAGAVFGAALTAAGVYSPSVIIGQMQLTDFHMLKAFLAASASSACVSLSSSSFLSRRIDH